MSYSLDVYFGKLKPTRRLLDVALFVAFFPQLVAGPIVRAAGFIPQLASARIFPAGVHTVAWDGRGDGGRKPVSGVYFLRLDTGAEQLSRKLTFLR